MAPAVFALRGVGIKGCRICDTNLSLEIPGPAPDLLQSQMLLKEITGGHRF
jgi:hypothetical protein